LYLFSTEKDSDIVKEGDAGLMKSIKGFDDVWEETSWSSKWGKRNSWLHFSQMRKFHLMLGN